MVRLYAVPGLAGSGVDELDRDPEPVPALRPAILEAIEAMRTRYFESITLSALSSEVFVSPFHFSRIFTRATGVTPGRYLTAVRLFEAKRLLLTTSLTVSDVVCSVGYSSVGTFTSRFSRAVGLTPTQYREPEVGELLVALAPNFRRLPPLSQLRAAGRACGSVNAGNGTIRTRVEFPRGAAPANLLIGVFADPVPQCGPVAFSGKVLTGSTDLEINGVPDGEWTVIAVAEHPGAAPAHRFTVAMLRQPIRVNANRPVYLPLVMRTPQPIDPPIAITLATRPTLIGGRQLAA